MWNKTKEEVSRLQISHHLVSSVENSALSDLATVDFRRGVAFLESGDALSARQAFLEQMRINESLIRHARTEPSLFSRLRSVIDSTLSECWTLILQIEERLDESYFKLPRAIEREEPHFALVYHGIRRHTMLYWPRLLNLWSRIRYIGLHKKISSFDPSQTYTLVEAGVSAGGGTVLLAVASHLFLGGSKNLQGILTPKVLAFDTFTGMPPYRGSEDYRLSDRRSPEQLGWGEGTCTIGGDTDALIDLATNFGVENLIQCVPGEYKNTLPQHFPESEKATFGSPTGFQSSNRALCSSRQRLV